MRVARMQKETRQEEENQILLLSTDRMNRSIFHISLILFSAAFYLLVMVANVQNRPTWPKRRRRRRWTQSHPPMIMAKSNR